MPTTKRTALTWDPTGWRNKRTAHGWLYNRSHLIGFQLSGENNNPKNLITGTQTLNNPEMLAHEMDIAYYLKQSDQHFVRYEVKPIYRGDELVARGVQMRAQSTGDNTIRFNVYIFNVEPGYTINYTDGTSVKG
jgi:DNA-entry nuclease